MEGYHVRILESAVRELQGIDRSAAHRIADRIRWLAANMDEIRPEPLAGNLAGFYKLRAGDYRVIYEILHDVHTILVHMIGHRSDIYRKARKSSR